MNTLLAEVKPIIRRALREDIGDGDVTTRCTVPAQAMLAGRFIAKEAGIVAGLEVARLTFAMLDERVEFIPHLADGGYVAVGQVIATVNGPGRALLGGERVAL